MLTVFEDQTTRGRSTESLGCEQKDVGSWSCTLSRSRDRDLPDCDEASVAFVSLLAQEVSAHSVMIVATASRDHKLSYVRGALDLFASASTTLELEPLTLEYTVELLSSVFGDVPNLEAVAQDVQRITAGNLRDIMRVAQHLVSEGAISYSAGTWRLPTRLSGAGLPTSMADALRARVEKLSVAAHTIALGLKRARPRTCTATRPTSPRPTTPSAATGATSRSCSRTKGRAVWRSLA
ncbi:MAG: hypothetical protein RLZZ450_775 [Pseudomonadota bacterium]